MASTNDSPRTSAVRVREASLSEYQQIVALTARNGLEVRTQEAWEHLWINNPVYRKFPNWAIGWVMEQDGEIVGFLGNIPTSYNFKGREIVSACTFSMSVDVPFRGHARLLINQLLRWGKANLEFHFCTTANEHSGPLSDRLKIPRVPVGDWSKSAFWIANYHEFLEAALERKGWPTLLAYPASVAIALRETVTRSRTWMRDTSHLRLYSEFDQRFDVFWEELKSGYPNRLLATRSRDVLDWHFNQALAGKRIWILTLNQGLRILAYAIFCRGDNPQIHLKRMCLIDFQSLNGDHEVLVSMLSWALRKCKEERIHMLEAFGFRPDKQCVIDRVAPYRRRLRAWAYFYRPVNQTLQEQLQDVDVWDPSQFDGDASL